MGQAHSMDSGQYGGYVTGRRMSQQHLRLGWWRCVRSELIKLTGLVSTWWMAAIGVALFPAMTALLTALTRWAADQEHGVELTLDMSVLWGSIGTASGLAAFVLAIMGVLSVTAEYTTSSIQTSLAANPRRPLFMASKLVALAVVTWIAALLGTLLSIAVFFAMVAGADVGSLPAGREALPFIAVLGAPVGVVAVAAIGQGLGALFRSTVGGVLMFIGLAFILPNIVSAISLVAGNVPWVGSIGYFLPMSAFSTFTRGTLDAQTEAMLTMNGSVVMPSWWQSGLIVLVWTAVAVAAGMAAVNRSDVK